MTHKHYCANRHCNSLNVIDVQDSRLVREFQACIHRPVHAHITDLKSASFAVNYVLKYISSPKEEFYDIPHFAQYIVGIRKKQLATPFGIFYKHKYKKPRWICPVCHTQIHVELDLQVIAMMEDTFEPPPSLFSFGEWRN